MNVSGHQIEHCLQAAHYRHIVMAISLSCVRIQPSVRNRECVMGADLHLASRVLDDLIAASSGFSGQMANSMRIRS